MDKSTFAPGEPVFLSLTLHNAGKVAEQVVQADPYSFCSGYHVHIARIGVPNIACSQGWGGSCLSGAFSLPPGASRTERLLLNYPNDSRGDAGSVVHAAGDYTVDATRDIAYAPPGTMSRLYTAPDHSEAHEVFHLRVDEAGEVSMETYKPYVQQLASKDDQVRREAARTLATLAPPALEPVLLTFASSKDYVLKQFAPLALATLGTRASMAELAQILLHTEPGTYEFVTAAEYLGKTHDPAWLPLLLEIADRHGAMYLPHAAESGGEAALPALLARLRSTDRQVSDGAVYALGHTGSRAAVPILISLLKLQVTPPKADAEDTAIDANAALMQLTHVYAEQGPDGAMENWQSRWQHWWLTSGSTALLYKPGECGENTPLP